MFVFFIPINYYYPYPILPFSLFPFLCYLQSMNILLTMTWFVCLSANIGSYFFLTIIYEDGIYHIN